MLHNRYTLALRVRSELQPNSLQLSDTVTRIAGIHRKRGDVEGALVALKLARDIRVAIAPGSLEAASAWKNLAQAQHMLGQPDAAVESYGAALRIHEACEEEEAAAAERVRLFERPSAGVASPAWK